MRRLSDIKIAYSIVMKYRQMHPTLHDRLNAVMEDINTVPIFESAQQNVEEEESKMEILKEEQTEDTDSLDKQELIDNEFLSEIDENPQTGSRRPSMLNVD